MAQTLVRFDSPVLHRHGGRYIVQACGRERDTGQWEAWLEFENIETGEVLRTQRETTQPNQKDAAYWATGLTPVYLEGALDRILKPVTLRAVEVASHAFFDGPAPRPKRRTVMADRDPVLDPFSVYEKNPGQLAQELTALRGWHLRQIIRDYDLVDESGVVLEALTEPELGTLIMDRMRELHP
jgi:hypothetical protein